MPTFPPLITTAAAAAAAGARTTEEGGTADEAVRRVRRTARPRKKSWKVDEVTDSPTVVADDGDSDYDLDVDQAADSDEDDRPWPLRRQGPNLNWLFNSFAV